MLFPQQPSDQATLTLKRMNGSPWPKALVPKVEFGGKKLELLFVFSFYSSSFIFNYLSMTYKVYISTVVQVCHL